MGVRGSTACVPSRVAKQSGFALPELLIGSVLALALIGSSVGVFTTSLRSEPRTSDRSSQVQEARTFAESISRELRQGWGAPVAGPSQLSILTYVKRATCAGSAAGPAIPCRVTYTCVTGTCSRVAANPDGTGAGAAVRVVEGLGDPNVFSYSPTPAAPTFVGIRLVFTADAGEDAITLTDGVALRNPTAPPAPGA
ncbi:MAG: PilW family protein [Solirubrobacterales bacterium]